MPTFHLRRLLWAGALAAGLAACAPPPPSLDELASDLVADIAASAFEVGPMGGPETSRAFDRSIAAGEAMRARRLELLAAADRVEPSLLSPSVRRPFDTAHRLLADAVRLDRHGFGRVGPGEAYPYAVSIDNGAHVELVRALIEEQPIRNAAEADAWLRSLARVGPAVRQENLRLSADVRVGLTPPAELLRATVAQVRALEPTSVETQPLLAHFASALASAPDIAPEVRVRMMDEARAILADEVAPAMKELAATLSDLEKEAPDIGLWRQKSGATYYADLLAVTCGADLSPDNTHKLATALVEQQTERLNDLLTGLGIAEGSVAERLAAYGSSPAAPATDAVTPIDVMLRDSMQALTTRAARMTSLPSPALPRIEMKTPRAPLDFSFGALQLSVRGPAPVLEVDATLSAATPDWRMPTLLARETIPGRLLVRSVAASTKDRSAIDSIARFPAFEEGWSSYAEDIAAESGVYDQNLPGRVGYYRSKLLEAALLAADTGVHHLKWTRADAALYLQATVGLSAGETEQAVSMIARQPASACAPAIGRESIRQMRIRAETALGTRFDAIAFHDLILAGGLRPMSLVSEDVNAWIDQMLRPAPAANTGGG